MKRFACVLSLVLVCSAAAADETGFTPLYNGKDLAGWDTAGRDDIWKVVDGIITGETTPDIAIKTAYYLISTAEIPDNFILKLSFRMNGAGSNSGVQFRSKILQKGDWKDVFGYQADVDESGQWTGCLFHSTRGRVAGRGFVDTIDDNDKNRQSLQFDAPAHLIQAYKKGDWNDYEIAAKGNLIMLKINGTFMCAVNDKHATEAAKSGIVALQIHPPKPMKIEFKNIRVKELK